MATPTSRAQEVITCDLCPKPTQQFCNNCQVSLCFDCVSQHVDKFKSLAHDIVHFTDREIQPVFPECKFHPDQRCEAHCQQCDVNVCLKCIAASHNDHDIFKMDEVFNDKKEEIEKENQEIESTIIPQYKKKTKDTESKISETTAKFDELKEGTEKHRKLWHQEVDTIFNKLGSLIMSMRENSLTPLKSQESKLKDLIPDMIQTVQQNKDILKTNIVSEVNNYKSKLKEYRDIPPDTDVKIPSLNTNTVHGRELSIELGEYKAKLTQTALSNMTDEVSYLSMRELLDKATLIATIPTGITTPLWSVEYVGRNKAWVNGEDKDIKCVNIHGSIKDSVTTTCQNWPGDISLTREGELIYSDYISETVNIVRGKTNEVMITTPRGWKPSGLCCTRAGDILVSVRSNKQNKIIRYQGGIFKQEIDKDEDGNPIFEEGFLHSLFVAENSNGDICVSDGNAKLLSVVDKEGLRVQFKYDGTKARKEYSFIPRQIVTDAMSQIIVTDLYNACVHILDQNGQLLRCVDNCGLDKPTGLSVDRKGRLWVGLCDSGDVKVIQYMK